MSESIQVAPVDCCIRPTLQTVKVLHESSHEDEAVVRCAACGAHWFWRLYEHVDFSEGNDEINCSGRNSTISGGLTL